jgi:hypothetical protein
VANNQVNGSANGWMFQVSAGIVLTLKHIKDVEKIKIEGKTEDIELTFFNGKGIYAQAKSVLNIDDVNNNSKYLKKALHSLDRISNNNFKLIYITNIRNPLNSKSKHNYPHEGEYSFENEISKEDQDIIRKIVSTQFRFEDFSIYKLYFFGEGDNVYKSIKDEIKEFLIRIKVDSSYNQKLLESWVFQYITNCRDEFLMLSKKEFIFPLILVLIERDISDAIQEKMNIIDDYDKISSRYRNIISEKKFQFEFVAKVLSDYQKNRGVHTKESYVNENWSLYNDDFSSLCDIDVEPLIKTIIWKIINERTMISTVKQEVKL